MHLLRTEPLVRELSAGAVSAEERAKYLLASFVLFNIAYYSGAVLSTAPPWTIISALEGGLMVALNVIGVVKTFDASGGRKNPDFVTQFTCLYVPVSITTLAVVWGSYWLLRLGFGGAIEAISRSNFQFAVNLSTIGTDLFGFLTFVANISVLAITYLRLHRLLSQVSARSAA